MGGLRGRLRNLEHEAEEHLVAIRQVDGTVRRFREEDWTACFLHEYDRGRRHFRGEEPGLAHPMVEALKLPSAAFLSVSMQGVPIGGCSAAPGTATVESS
jgi:hypothetical protein